MHIDIKIQKDILRKDILQRRNKLNKSEIELKSQLILNRLIDLDKLKNSKKICVYVSKDSEVGTFSLINRLINMDKSLYAPKCDIKSNYMAFYKINSLSDLSIGAFSVLEPSDKTDKYVCSNKSDICIVPALCFDKQGFRLGYGKGYYDRFLKDFNGIKTGICYDEFVVEALPKFDTDIAVDLIITDVEKYLCKGGK